jgi:hypothetical protein
VSGNRDRDYATWQGIPGAGPTVQCLPFAAGWLVRGPAAGLIYVPDPEQQSGDASAGTTAILAAIEQLSKDLQTMSQTNQQHADAIAAQLTTIDATLKTGVAAITAEIATLKAANPAVDFTGVDAAVANLGTDVAAAAAVPTAA